MKKFILLIILCMMIVSCHRYFKDLRYALEYSGDNRVELEKVLNYYSKDSANSLKLKAAEFLITYMPGHVSYGGEEIGEYYDRVDSVLSLPVDATQKRELVERIATNYPHLENNLTVKTTNTVKDIL